jgi:hypothetical protein
VSSARILDLPPPFRSVALRELHDAFEYTTTHAAALGGGALVFVGRFDIADFAVVLEPDEPLAAARRAFYAGMLALTDTLAALAPPETSIAIAWPDVVEVGGRLVGGGRLAWPHGAKEDATPDWLVFGAVIRLILMSREETRLFPLLSSALENEGFVEIGVERVIEGFARHLMTRLDRQRHGDFASLSRDFLPMATGEQGARLAIDTSDDLRSALETPSWLSPGTGTPRQ